MRGSLGLRVAVWYAAVFVTSVIVLVALTYGCCRRRSSSGITRSSSRRCASTRRAYETGGLQALARAVELEVSSGRHERLFVRVLGPRQDALFYTLPPEWNQFDVDALAPGAAAAEAAVARRRTAARIRGPRRAPAIATPTRCWKWRRCGCGTGRSSRSARAPRAATSCSPTFAR